MTKALFALTLLLATCIHFACGQSGIAGKVMDAQTAQPLEFANIYVNRTTIGTATANDGSFRLAIPPGDIELIVSLIGYKTQKINLTIVDHKVNDLVVKLFTEETSLAEITISAKDEKEWQRNFEQFQKAFLGKDDIADKCIILNKEVLNFTPAKKGSGFTASALAPLEVLNPMLGYKLRYELVGFSYSREAYAIAGNIQFENLVPESAKVLERWNANRQTAYRNSLRGLLKSVIDNHLHEDGFEVYVEKNAEPTLGRTSLFSYFRPWLDPFERSKHLRDTLNGNFIFHSKTRLEVHDTRGRNGIAYRDVRYPVSWIELSQPLHVSPAGVVYNQRAVQLIGHLSSFRVAHLLPEDYVPGKTTTHYATPAPIALTEQIYLHTDREYYYPGDPIWLKGYMNYSDPQLADSMSRVAYVELIDTSKKVISRSIFPIEYGTFDGQLIVPSSLGKCNLAIRAYTQWMRNFDNAFFVKPIPVLDHYERALEDAQGASTAVAYRAVIKSTKQAYQHGEDIDLAIHVVNTEGDTVAADLSMTVTDLDLVKPQRESTPIEQAFGSVPSLISQQFRIEKGITVEGRFTIKGKPVYAPVLVTAVIGQLEDMTSVRTNKAGDFHISGFHFYDSSSVGLQALNKQKKPYGEFSLLARSFPEVGNLPDAATPVVTKGYNAIPKSVGGEDDGGILLKEVTVTGRKEKPYRDMYTSGEITMSGDRVRELNPVDLMAIFRGRIPRVRVSWMMDEMGILQEYLMIGTSVPMVVIDGVAMEGAQAMRMVKSISIQDVERIEVLPGSSASLYGTRGMNGVVIILTRTQHGTFNAGDRTKFSTRDFSMFPIQGFSSFKPFQQSSGEHSSSASTVYWHPYLLLNAGQSSKVSFKASSRSSRYLVSIRGFTRDGAPVAGSYVISLVD
ncbi:MAG TPA: carboxypeptidase-like regulatory domain-containing protein [Chryseosolibacter sp.]